MREATTSQVSGVSAMSAAMSVAMSVASSLPMPNTFPRNVGSRGTIRAPAAYVMRLRDHFADCWRSTAALTRPAKSGCGRVGRERSSGWAWVATR